VDRRWLLIETSGRDGLAGLAEGTAVVAERRLDSARRHAQDLAPVIADLLNSRKWRASEIDCVAVGLGPGSYTGLRVGVMTGQAFAHARGCRMVGVPTFQNIALGCSLTCAELEVIGDALKGKCYAQRFRRESAAMPFTIAAELAILAQSEWLARLAPEVGVSGPGLPAVESRLQSGTQRTPEGQRGPTLSSLLSLAAAAPETNRREPSVLEPIYLRPSSAEQQWDNRG
jgi:tRNA threonylcarbamoyladenosine biosynthesis protein TsaB